MLQNARVTTFTVSELLRENKQGEGGKIIPLLTLIRVKDFVEFMLFWKMFFY